MIVKDKVLGKVNLKSCRYYERDVSGTSGLTLMIRTNSVWKYIRIYIFLIICFILFLWQLERTWKSISNEWNTLLDSGWKFTIAIGIPLHSTITYFYQNKPILGTTAHGSALLFEQGNGDWKVQRAVIAKYLNKAPGGIRAVQYCNTIHHFRMLLNDSSLQAHDFVILFNEMVCVQSY